MRIPILGIVIDERFLSHRQRSTSLASVSEEWWQSVSSVAAIYGWNLELGPVRGRRDDCSSQVGVDGLVFLNRLNFEWTYRKSLLSQ